MTRQTDAFVDHLLGLSEDRGALAALRRGLGQPPGAAPDMYRYVVPWLGPERRPEDDDYFILAALFAMHPSSTRDGNMGAHFARAKAQDPNQEAAIERRFAALLAAHPDDLPFYLRQAVSFLRSKEIPINWHELMADLRYWDHPKRRVQQKWARAFWAASQKPDAAASADAEDEK